METVEQLPNGLMLLQDDQYFKLGQDSVLLSHFAHIPRRARVLDLGCGTGVLSMLCWRKDLQITGLELQEGPARLFSRSIEENALTNVSVIQGDLRAIRSHIPHGSMQYVLCNPPYFATESVKSAAQIAHATARQDETASISEIVSAIAWVLPTGGRCALVFRPERLCPLLSAFASHGLTPKRMRFVYQTASSAPSAVMIACRRGGADGLVVEPPLLVCDADGVLSAEYRMIYGK